MVTRPALECLSAFIASPTQDNASRLVGIPALLLALEAGKDTNGVYDASLIAIAVWIKRRVESVWDEVRIHDAPEARDDMVQDDWRKVSVGLLSHGNEMLSLDQTGCCYSLPKIRHRPKYPSLAHDQRAEKVDKRGGKCNKYYAQYGEKRLTGGIMVAWCTHSICYGFHCIPKGEGRNDVFAAMLTRFRRAPKRCVYDFACALGPYCLLRETEFFADTLFVIDTFHSSGHTKCTASCFLRNYSSVDPSLAHINPSAAECGNSGVKKIRKSVSYMGQSRAIVYTRTYFSIWNRERMKAMAKEMAKGRKNEGEGDD